MLWSKEDLTAAHSPSFGGVLNNGAFDGERFYVMSNEPESTTGGLADTTGDVYLHAFDGEGEPAWEAKKFEGKLTWGMASVANGVLAAPINNELHILDAETGEELVMFDTGGSIAAGAPAIADGMIVVKSGLQYFFGQGNAFANDEVHGYGLP